MSIIRATIAILPLVFATGTSVQKVPSTAQDPPALLTMEYKKLTDARKKEIVEKVRTLYGDDKIKPHFLSEDEFKMKYGTASGRGVIARGVIIDEQKDELTLDIDPCTAAIATFRQPYVKRDAGEVTCGDGKKYPRQEIEQKSRVTTK